jgi:integrase/recombinase XerD
VPYNAKEVFILAEQSKRKGGKIVSSRIFNEEEVKPVKEGKMLGVLFETFMRAKNLEGLRPRTLIEHKRGCKSERQTFR